MAVLSGRTGDEQQESRQAAEVVVVVVWGGSGGVTFYSATHWPWQWSPSHWLMALSDSVSCSLSLPLYLFLFRSLFLSFLFSSTPPLLSLSHSLPLLVPSEFSSLAMAAKMHHHLSAAAHPPLTSRLLFSRQAGLKSQLRIEPSRLKPVSNQCSPPPPPSLQPQTCVAGYRRKMDEEQVPLLSSVP